MAQPQYDLLHAADLRHALAVLGDIADASSSADDFARAGVQLLSRLVPGELVTLSRCDLHTSRRTVVGTPAGAVGSAERAAFDRYFDSHPLVRHHSVERGACAHRISDSLTRSAFLKTGLYNDYYRRLGLAYAIALPIRMDGRELVSFVLNRSGRDFADRELATLDVIRRPLQRLFDQLDSMPSPAPVGHAVVQAGKGPLSRREADVLRWVAAGKTDHETALLLGLSPRTVHKHLQHAYAKLGVENRTAAVMRLLGARDPLADVR